VVDGIMSTEPQPGEITLGQIPFGTGGDFKRVLQNSSSYHAALASLPIAPTFRCDVGRIEFVNHKGEPATRHFLNIASCGIGGLVDQIVNRTPKWLGGKLSFYLGTVRALFEYEPTRCRLTVDGELIGVFDLTGVFIANSRYAGGGMQFAPDALVDDGLFEVVVVPALPLWDSLLNLSAVYKGEHLARDEVVHCQGREIHVEPLDGTLGLLDVDGEAPGRIPATFSVVPGAIKVANLVPEVRSGV
jgi:diacylglycerol kinase family enzyme